MVGLSASSMTADQRESWQLQRLREISPQTAAFASLSDLRQLPVMRKEALLASQQAKPPFGALPPQGHSHIFQSPGPIYEAGFPQSDPWRFGRFLAAIGIGATDVVLNTFSYHFSPAGAMFETAARAVDAVVFPAGPGQSRQQAEVAAAIGATVYAGTPDFLQRVLDKADEHGLDMSAMAHAAVSAGPLFPALRQAYADRGISCRQCYGTADVGLIAYESETCTEGLYIDDDVVLEIVSPGTGDPVPEGEIGEVVVTILSEHHPMLRFSVGDLSALMPPEAGARRRIVGWRGRADQATKVRGVFIRPEQVAALVKNHELIERVRVEVSVGDAMNDRIQVQIETTESDASLFADLVRETFKLNVDIVLVAPGSLPRDGILVADQRPVA